MLKRLGYLSKFTRPMTCAEIESLAKDAAQYNRSVGITGMLVATGRTFYQVIEGPAGAVNVLFQKIMSDARHGDVLVLTVDDNVADRQFPGWPMQTVNLDAGGVERFESIKELIEGIMQQRDSMRELMSQLSRAAWHELMGE